MDESKPAADLIDRACAGDPGAVGELFVRYAQRLSRFAEQHLSRKLAGRVGGEDVVQSVFRTFFRRCAVGEFRVDNSADIWRLLVKITLLKARALGRFHTAAKRDVTAEAKHGDDDWLSDALAREPGPAEAAALVDQIENLLRGLPDLYGSVLELRLAGHSVAEIAPKLGVSRRTVYRALDLLKQRIMNNSSENA